MAKIMVIQHVPYEPLGILDRLIRTHRHRIRYVNFARAEDHQPNISGYQALIILGGPMNVTEIDKYPFLENEIQLIQQALADEIPILGICLGCQLLAAALGAKVYPAKNNEIGWYQLAPTQLAGNDPLMQCWQPQETIFQWHGYTFDLPISAHHLVKGSVCTNQAFRYGKYAYGLQFHLEVELNLIKRWLHLPVNANDLDINDPQAHIKKILQDTERYLARSQSLATDVFNAFINFLPQINQHILL